MAFNFKTATNQELLDHILKSPSANISVAKAYHKKVGNLDVVARIDHARNILKQARIEERLDSLKQENLQHGIIAERTSSTMD